MHQRSGDPLRHGQSAHTPYKQELFRRILRQQASIVAGFQRRDSRVGHFLYLDLFAGPGQDDQGHAGSPIIAQEVLRGSGASWIMGCYDKNGTHAAALAALLEPTGPDRAPVYPGACEALVPTYLATLSPGARSAMRGVCYVDPNGDVPWPLLATISAALPGVDMLIHLSATMIKRQRECEKIPRTSTLREYVATVPKRCWLMSALDSAHQWTVLLGSNWPKQPGIKEIRFMPLDSDLGRAFFRRANYTKDELRHVPIDGQLGLF